MPILGTPAAIGGIRDIIGQGIIGIQEPTGAPRYIGGLITAGISAVVCISVAGSVHFADIEEKSAVGLSPE